MHYASIYHFRNTFIYCHRYPVFPYSFQAWWQYHVQNLLPGSPTCSSVYSLGSFKYGILQRHHGLPTLEFHAQQWHHSVQVTIAMNYIQILFVKSWWRTDSANPGAKTTKSARVGLLPFDWIQTSPVWRNWVSVYTNFVVFKWRRWWLR